MVLKKHQRLNLTSPLDYIYVFSHSTKPFHIIFQHPLNISTMMKIEQPCEIYICQRNYSTKGLAMITKGSLDKEICRKEKGPLSPSTGSSIRTTRRIVIVGPLYEIFKIFYIAIMSNI